MTNSPQTRQISGRLLRPIRSAALAVATAALLSAGGCATAPTGAPVESLEFPSPISGPGLPAIEKDARRHIESGWQALRRGDTATARTSATEAGTGLAARLLEFQTDLVAGNRPVQALEDLTQTVPEYAAAWLTLSVAAEKEGDEALALQAAARGATLWSDKRWIERSQNLRHRWIDDRVRTATGLFEEDKPKAALDALQPALSLDPQNRNAVLLKARVLIEMNEPDRAEAILSGLPRDRDVVLLAGYIAEYRGDTGAAIRIYSSLQDDPEAILMAINLAEEEGSWQTAMDLYSSLPDSQPEKARGLSAAKLRWRVSVMPEYVHEAFAATEMNRSDLAVLIVTLAPTVETLPSKQVPLLSDIVDMPSQEEIITAARLGLIDIDRLEHRFHPLRTVTADEVRSTISNLGRLLEISEPTWCDEEPVNPCVSFAQPIAGDQVANVIIDMVTGEGS